MISIKDDKRCCGCGACQNVCPKNCISMRESKEGFRYPIIDETKCIHCGLCERACPYLNLSVKGDILKQPIAYYTRSRDEDILKTSSSGGIFAELAKQVLLNGGIVFGAVWGDRYDEVYHRSICSIEELHLLQGSKYVQSDMRRCYSEAKEILQSGRLVLFSGTPCQIAGLLSFLGQKDYDNLLTCDLICHGVPTPLALRRFVAEKEKETGKKVSKYFRDKAQGWKPGVFKVEYFDKTYDVILPADNKILEMFTYYNTYHRSSCYGCTFERSPRIADISLGDYFVEKNALDLNGNEVDSEDNKGCSLITINTVQGSNFFAALNGSVDCKQLQLHTVTAWHLFRGPGLDIMRRKMFFYLYQKGFSISKLYNILYRSGWEWKGKRLYYEFVMRIHNVYGGN